MLTISTSFFENQALTIPIAAIFIHSLAISFLNYNILVSSIESFSFHLPTFLECHLSLPLCILLYCIKHEPLTSLSRAPLSVSSSLTSLYQRITVCFSCNSDTPLYISTSISCILLGCLRANPLQTWPRFTPWLPFACKAYQKKQFKVLQLRSLPLMLKNTWVCTVLSFGVTSKWPIFCWNWKLRELGMVFIPCVCVEGSTTQAHCVTNGSRLRRNANIKYTPTIDYECQIP